MRNHLGHIYCLFLLAGFVLAGCTAESPGTLSNDELADRFQQLLSDAVTSDPAVHSATMLVDAPLRQLGWKGAAGTADPAEDRPMTVEDQFRTASLGKMTLATLVMKHIEAGYFQLDDVIHQYLSDSIMTGLHIFQGQDYGHDMTIHQLLNHSSGLPDYITDGDEDADGLPDFLELLIADPLKFWTPEETIEYTKLHLMPFFRPGHGFHYSDTNFQLLGLILQNVTQKPLHVLYRDELFDLLGMDHTYLEYYDDPRPSIPGKGISHVYFGDIDYTDWFSNSADWAGGGLISTTQDLDRFLRSFVNDDIFQNPQTKNLMMDWLKTNDYGIYYGLGMVRFDLTELGQPWLNEIYGHDGFPQSFMFYWPKQQVTITGTLNQALSEKTHYDQLILEVLLLLND